MFTPTDQDVRTRIRESLGETLFVEAGAGTGKTTSLVARVVTLLTSGRTTLDRVAAITFTEAAAAELRDRIRNELEAMATCAELTERERERCRCGIEDLDQASIGTLHGFATAILTERPLEAGLPPVLEIMDQIASDLAFEDAWSSWIDSALGDELDIPTLPLALTLGLTLDHLRQIAVKFHQNYDLLEDASLQLLEPPTETVVDELMSAAPELARLCEFSKLGPSDTLYDHVQRLLPAIGRLSEPSQGSLQTYRLLSRAFPIRQTRGRQTDWATDPISGENACRRLKDILSDLHAEAEEELEQVRLYALMPILRELRSFVLGTTRQRKRDGRAGFHDQLVWARDVLRDDLSVRDHFRSRFSHLLIDEAQDTDPLQTEIAMFLSESVPDSTLPRPSDWRKVLPEPGKLFVVGDPKQSIYRFRRADVRQVHRLQKAMGGATIRLVQNFRSQKPVVDWVNQLFGKWMTTGGHQPEYVALSHRWGPKEDQASAPAVWSVGGEQEDTTVGPVRQREAEAIATLLTEVGKGAWRILDREATEEYGEERYRPSRFSDVCLLMPSRTALRSLEVEFDSADVPYRLEGAALIFETQEVRDLLNCLKSIDDPSDQVATVAALRSPGFACSDVDLLEFSRSGGSFNYLHGLQTPTGRVSESLEELCNYHDVRTWLPVPTLIERFVRRQHLMEVALDHPRTREQWRRYRFIVDAARSFVEVGGNSLRSFLTWVGRQEDEGVRITESPVPEGDEEAVRVMTVHGAKGLEFPIVVLAGLNSARSSRREAVLFDRETQAVEVSVGPIQGRFVTPGYDALKRNEDEAGEEEYVRLLYVAATRARDHLAVSTYRTRGDTSTPAAQIAKLMEGGDEFWQQAPELEPTRSPPESRPGNDIIVEEHSSKARGTWQVDRELMLIERGRPTSVSATALAGVAKEDPDHSIAEVDEPWKRGRGGAPLGRAVHSVLQTVDLATGRGLYETSVAQAAAEGIPHRQAEVASLVDIAVNSDIVTRAVESGRYWREVPAAVPVGSGVLQGYIDLLFEENGELVVVDYKTDAIDAAQTQYAAERYRLQAGAYALMMSRSTGMTVKEVVFLFLRPRREQVLTAVAALGREAERVAEDYFLRSKSRFDSSHPD